MLTLEGLSTSKGIAMGRLLVLESGKEYEAGQTVEDTDAELARALDAIETAKDQLRELYDKALVEVGEEAAAIFDIHVMMLEDEDYLDSIRSFIEGESQSAEYSVYATGKQLADMFIATGDPYMQERAADLRDLTHRVTQILSGRGDEQLTGMSEPIVVAAEELLPSQTVQMDKKFVLAFLSNKGSRNSHASILARSLNIPAITSLGNGFRELTTGDFCIVDGLDGFVILSPDADTIKEYERKIAELNEEKQRLLSFVSESTETLDGVRIELCANIGRPDEATNAKEQGAEGVGLFRSEFLYLESHDFPTEEQQFVAYKQALEVMQPHRVVVRTLDLGADKQAPYFNLSDEDNPALGYRAIRICLDRMDIFIPQLRALLRASTYGRLAVMFPMITGVEELREIRRIVAATKDDLDKEGIPYAKDVEMGIMIETPASVVIADQLAKEADFFSIGTNDLTQYTFAADRMNPKVGRLFDPGSLAILRMIRHVADVAHKNGIWVGICGESAADISLLPYYIGMGIDELSVSVPEVLRVRAAVRALKKADCESACEVFFGN